MSDWQATYTAHLRSPYWRALREEALAAAGRRCAHCGNVAVDLQLHHKHYRTLGKETHDDVELLCPPCHEKGDEQRAKEGAARSRKALYGARLRGWARHRYPEDWLDDPAMYDEIAERFDEWCEARE